MRAILLHLATASAAGAAMFFVGRSLAPDPNVLTPAAAALESAQARSLSTGIHPASHGAVGASEEKKDRWSSYRDAGGLISAERMGDAIRDVLLEPDPLKALEDFSSLIRQLTPENAEAAIKSLNAHGGRMETARFLPLLAFAWGQIDGAGALEKLKTDNREDGFAKFSAIGGWASKDPQAALAYIQELEKKDKADGGKGGRDAEATRWLKMGLISGLGKVDAAAALNMVMSFPEDERRNLIGVLTNQQMKLGVEQAAQWAAGLADEKLRSQALTSISREMARENPAKAAEWIAAHSGEEGMSDAVGGVAREWADKDPKSALAWVMTLPAGEAQTEAMGDTFRSWSRKDPEASSQYLNSMAAGPAKDAAIGALARSVVREDPSAAITWAKTIQDEAARNQALVRTVTAWRYADDAAAQQWILQSGLPVEVQQQMTAPLEANARERFAGRRPAGGAPTGNGGFRGGPGGSGRGRGGR